MVAIGVGCGLVMSFSTPLFFMSVSHFIAEDLVKNGECLHLESSIQNRQKEQMLSLPNFTESEHPM